jgi:hypothetical protein
MAAARRRIEPEKSHSMNQWINDAEIMALEEWVNHVDFVKGIFPKLPVHFQNHKERFDKNERALIVLNKRRTYESWWQHWTIPFFRTRRTNAQDAGIEVNSEPQRRHHNQPAYDQYWPPISQPERLLQSAASAYDDEYQSHVGGVRISCYPEVGWEYKEWGNRGRENSKEEAALHTLHHAASRL